MNAPHESPDPLLHSLAEEASNLPVRAAIAARQRNAKRRQTRQRLMHAAVFTLLGVITWKSVPSHDTKPFPAESTLPATTPHPSGLASLPSVEPPADAPGLLPTGLNEDQQRFVEAARDLPLLLVRDSSGKVTRIHVVER